MSAEIQTIDEYIVQFPVDVQQKLQLMREMIQAAAPDATEKMSYGIPTFFYLKNLVHFAAFAKHIGFYPTSSGIEHFREALTGYRTSKGTVKFPLNEPLPLELIEKIVAWRVQENIEKYS